MAPATRHDLTRGVTMTDDGINTSTSALSWMPGGGIILEVQYARQDWLLPPDAVVLPGFHVTLIGRKALLEHKDLMETSWTLLRSTLPQPCQPELDIRVHQATDGERRTWFLNIVNQEEFRSYVGELTRHFDEFSRQLNGRRFTNFETDRYFHVSVANNRGGDPLQSIGSIKPPADDRH